MFVRPELVAEVALDGVQVSPRYPGGEDKTATEADTIETLRALLS